jgi:Tfp pilus assembly protein PilW
VTLVELLITFVLTAVLGTILVSAVVSSDRLFRRTDEEAAGQTDVRVTIERLGRDVRNARSLDPGATASQLVIWIDSNSDYKQQPAELVTWRLVAGTNGHFDVARVRNGVTIRTSRLVISQLAFCYRATEAGACLATPLTQAQANSVKLVNADILYAASATRAGAARHTVFTERMRNVS